MPDKKQQHKQTSSEHGRTNQRFFRCAPLVPRREIHAHPVILGSESTVKRFNREVKNTTDSDVLEARYVDTTPQGRHLNVDAQNRAGQTAGGGILIYSPTQHFTVEVVSPSGKNKETISLILLRREVAHQPKSMSALFTVLSNQNIHAKEPLQAISTNAVVAARPSRKKVEREKNVIGKTATQLVIEYFQNLNLNISSEQIEAGEWTLCHLLSFAIYYHAIDAHGDLFDTQRRKNIFAGSRVLNENMTRVEDVLLQFLQDNAVKEIQAIVIHSEFEDSHILSGLTLDIKMLTHDNRVIQFQFPFDIADHRKMPVENTTAYYALLKSIIDKSALKNKESGKRRQRSDDNDQEEDVSRQLFSPDSKGM